MSLSFLTISKVLKNVLIWLLKITLHSLAYKKAKDVLPLIRLLESMEPQTDALTSVKTVNNAEDLTQTQCIKWLLSKTSFASQIGHKLLKWKMSYHMSRMSKDCQMIMSLVWLKSYWRTWMEIHKTLKCNLDNLPHAI